MSRAFETLMAFATLVSIILISVEYLIRLRPEELFLIYLADFAIVVLFAAEFLGRLKRQRNRSSFMKGRWYEIPSMLPAFLFVILETSSSFGVFFRSLRLIRILRLVGITSRIVKLGIVSSDIIRRSRLLYIMLLTGSAIFLSTIGIYSMEREAPGSQINSIWEALWWSINTISTVALPAGNPVTPQGRLMASVIIFLGVAFVGLFTSLLVTTLVERRLKATYARTLKDSVIEQIIRRLEKFEDLSPEEVSMLKRLVDTLCDERLAKQAS